jgi:hypothetical protein
VFFRTTKSVKIGLGAAETNLAHELATSHPGSFFGKTLAAAGHVPHQQFSARGGVRKVSNYINMLPVG